MKPLLLALLLLHSAGAWAQTTGPEKGALVIVGGGRLPREVVDEFIALAGGSDAPFVIIPTADVGENWGAEYIAKSFLGRAGVKNVTVLHTRDRAVADSELFVAPLLAARGVWFDGGRQWRLVDSYLGTRTQRELEHVLARGGVIGGTSAGATIQGSYLVRGAPEGNLIMMAKGHEEGFGYLKDSAIDQHVLTRHRENDLAAVIDARPELLGIGLDEATAIIVQAHEFRVIGASKVVIHDHDRLPDEQGTRWFLLSPGERFDLRQRRRVSQ